MWFWYHTSNKIKSTRSKLSSSVIPVVRLNLKIDLYRLPNNISITSFSVFLVAKWELRWFPFIFDDGAHTSNRHREKKGINRYLWLLAFSSKYHPPTLQAEETRSSGIFFSLQAAETRRYRYLVERIEELWEYSWVMMLPPRERVGLGVEWLQEDHHTLKAAIAAGRIAAK